MNYEHIEALMKAGDTLYEMDCAGVAIISEGHIAAPKAYLQLAGVPPSSKNLDGLWRKWSAMTPSPIVIGEAFKGYGFIRKVGSSWLNEAFFRCFSGDNVTWTVCPGKDGAILAHEHGTLIGVVMPTRAPDHETDPASDLSDEDVFENFACEANGFYLVTVKKLSRQIGKLMSELHQARGQRDDLTDEIDRLAIEITQKRNILAAKIETAKVTA